MQPTLARTMLEPDMFRHVFVVITFASLGLLMSLLAVLTVHAIGRSL